MFIKLETIDPLLARLPQAQKRSRWQSHLFTSRWALWFFSRRAHPQTVKGLCVFFVFICVATNLYLSQQSLKQLIRLQISEFWQRFLLSFVKLYYNTPTDFGEDCLHLLSSKVLAPLASQSQDRQADIQKTLHFYKSFYDQPTATTENVQLTNEVSMNWSICRNVRKNLYTSLSMYV